MWAKWKKRIRFRNVDKSYLSMISRRSTLTSAFWVIRTGGRTTRRLYRLVDGTPVVPLGFWPSLTTPLFAWLEVEAFVSGVSLFAELSSAIVSPAAPDSELFFWFASACRVIGPDAAVLFAVGGGGGCRNSVRLIPVTTLFAALDCGVAGTLFGVEQLLRLLVWHHSWWKHEQWQQVQKVGEEFWEVPLVRRLSVPLSVPAVVAGNRRCFG